MENTVVVTFDAPSTAYQALSTLKELDGSGRLSLQSAVVVERQADGQPVVRDDVDGMNLIGTEPRGLLGSLVDILAEPDGETVGAAHTASLPATISTRIPAGSTALIAEIDEYAVEVVDGAMGQLGGTVARQASDAVKGDIKAAKDARRAAEKEAERREKEARERERERERAERHNQGIDKAVAWLEGQRKPEPAQPQQ